ncbi:tRNA lysidine(34) synthetase TilS [Pontiella sulfatireligans]|uniref:tRNA(Ile)-lysidine synthase n=1 Tax=Pontiella sulfatireligans TaxID=2750658 RepID=A0A6C2UM82_9BACT|nr:tRNA lysidine(34) synthetase TilS [Pontiella sulfatireligans]VGO21382.1 tRNA(Ile)-lysidine synthase [Pontiella sulfatireligans]
MGNTQYAVRNTLNTLPETIRAAIGRHGLIPDGMNLVVGVSGGADSVALAHALHQLEIPFTIAHLNHQLRGAASAADERFVRELGFPAEVKSVDVRKLAEETGLSIEMAARQARHEFFAEFDNAVIALAHHADDQAETFILKLARGAGTEGLGGMPFSQRIGPVRLIRPMLNIPRAEILQWLESNQFKWKEDASNSDEAFLRNRVRHTILPLLEKELNPNIRETILRTMNILREENDWMEAMQDQSQSLAARRRQLRQWLFENGAAEAGFDAVEKILALIDSGEGTTVFELNNRQRVVVEYGKPRFEEGCSQPQPAQWTLSTEKGTGWRPDHGKGAGELPAEASFNAGKIGGSPIEVRNWQPGDRMAPLGMEGTRKLQDILTDQKIPRAQRESIPVVVCRGEIIWIPGYRTARGWKVEGANGKSVHVRIEQNGVI